MTQNAPNIFIVGPMGSGKTTIGKRVASALGLEFIDCDRELEIRTGVDVTLIFDIEGESGFRARESRLLDELTGKNGVLLATGGGVVISPENRELLTSRGLVVYLKTQVEHQLSRLYRDSKRPLLQTSDRAARLQELAEKRNPLYDSVADLTVESTGLSLPAMAKKVTSEINACWQAEPESSSRHDLH